MKFEFIRYKNGERLCLKPLSPGKGGANYGLGYFPHCTTPSLASNIKLELTGKNKTENLGISTKTPESINPLLKLLVKIVKNMSSGSNVVINNVRHLHALKEGLISVEKVKKGLKNNITGDLLSVDLKDAINHIGSITGNIDHDEDILGTIFSQFCIGK